MISFIKKNYIYVSPFLIAVYTVLFLYANNLSEFRISVLPVPLIIALVYAMIIYLAAKLIVKKTEIVTLLSSAIILLSLSYLRIALLIARLPLDIGKFSLNQDVATCLLISLIFMGVYYVTFKFKSRLVVANKVVTILSFALVIFSVFNITRFEVGTGRLLTADTKNVKIKIKKIPYNGARPDIYYFIFDRYAGPRALLEQYQFDNAVFLNFLRQKGFYITANSTANYPKTFLSLASSLNMEYLDFMTKKTNNGVSSDESLVTPLIRNNKVMEFLKARGYRFINVGSWWEATAVNQNADKNYTLHYGVYPFADEFMTGYLNTTIAAPILKSTFHDPTAVSSDPQNNLHRRMIYYEFDNFKEIPQIPGPKFVFAHILIPHDPFVLDQNCQPIDEGAVNAKQHQENYLNQLKCANSKIQTLTNQLLKNSKNAPVIVYQADEGPFPMNSPLPPNQSWATASEQSLREKFPILNAYFFPGIKETHLYEGITPVNSWRVLLNNYFGTNYSLLPDINYIFQDQNNYYKFIDVTSKVKN